MRILVTGGSGLLGSKVIEITIQKGYEVYLCYHKHKVTAGKAIHLDVTNREEVNKVFNAVKPEAVVHAAALTDVDKCEEDKVLAWEVNVEGTKNIVKESERCKAFLVYISTDYVFSGDKGMYKEEDEPNPVNYYGLTKLEGEKIVKTSNLEWCIVRTSAIYGSTPAAGKTNFALWVLNKLKNCEPISVVTDQWVSPTLNTNLSQMIIEVIEGRFTGVYHLAGATPLSRYKFATLIADTFNLDKNLLIPAKLSDMRWVARRPRNSSLDVNKALLRLRNKPLEVKESLKILREEINKNMA